MITDENLPDGWEAASETVEYDEVMDREYESKLYEHEDGEARVYINEVQEPNEFEGWGYQVIAERHVDDTVAEREFGPFEDMADAREVALDYMDESEA